MKKYKTSKKDFKLFKKECNKWINFFSLTDWEMFFEHRDIEGARANAVYNNEGRVATLSLATDFGDMITDDEIRRVAFHEVCEILLGDMGIMIKHYFSYNMATTEIHRVIRRLENSVFKNM